MKTNAKSLGIILFTLATAFFGCKKEDLSPLPGSILEHNSSKAADVTVPGVHNENKGMSNLSDGFWVVSAFYLHQPQTMEAKGGGQTQRFTDWRFVFNRDGQVFALKNGERVTGKWSRGTVNLKDDITLDFGTQYPFNMLNNTWQTRDQSRMWRFLEDKNTADGTSGYLVFKRME
ncbi:MAG: hypothetical protein JWO44_2109 [Bacteroidetes bacterium]|nr:hypothetical protein [Bacteroidota bacterium]